MRISDIASFCGIEHGHGLWHETNNQRVYMIAELGNKHLTPLNFDMSGYWHARCLNAEENRA